MVRVRSVLKKSWRPSEEQGMFTPKTERQGEQHVLLFERLSLSGEASRARLESKGEKLQEDEFGLKKRRNFKIDLF